MSNSADNSTNEPFAAESSMSDNSNDERRDSLPFAAEQASDTSVNPSTDVDSPGPSDAASHPHQSESPHEAAPFSKLKTVNDADKDDDFGSDTAVFAPAVVFGNLNPDLLGKIEGEIYAYNTSNFQPYTEGTQLEISPVAALNDESSHVDDQEEVSSLAEVKHAMIGGESDAPAPFQAVDQALDFSDVSETIPIPQDPNLQGEPAEWAETRYSDALIRDYRVVSESNQSEYDQKTPFPDDQSLHQVNLKDHGHTSDHGESDPYHTEEPTEPIQDVPEQAYDETSDATSEVVAEEPSADVVEDEAAVEEETVEVVEEVSQDDADEYVSVPTLPHANQRIDASQVLAFHQEDEGAQEEGYHSGPFEEVVSEETSYDEQELENEEVSEIVEESAPITEEPVDESYVASEEVEEPESSEEPEVIEIVDDFQGEVPEPSVEIAPEDPGGFYQEFTPLDANGDSSEETTESSGSSRDRFGKTMRLEAVTFLDEIPPQEEPSEPQEGDHQRPPVIRRSITDSIPAIPANQGPPPKHRPMGAPPTTTPPSRRTLKQGRPAGPPPKRRLSGELSPVSDPQRPVPPAMRNTGGANRVPPTAAGHVAQGPPPSRNLPPKAGQQIPGAKPHMKTPPPVNAAPKSSGDPQMDEIIQQLIDENNRKEVASTDPAATAAASNNRRLEWFSNYFGDDFLRSISPKQQQRTKREIEFMLRSLRPSPGASILDVACGYGRHSLEFAQRGYEVVGVDLSMTMLKRALNESNKRSAQLKKNLSVRFMQGDMRDIDYQSEFDCALLWQDSLGYFDNLGDAEALRKIFNALKPGGRFLIDTINRDYVVSLLPTRRIWFGVQAEIHEEVFFDSQTSVLFMKRTYLTNNRGVVRDYLSRIRLYSLHELLNLLRYIGFNVLEISGDILYRGQHLDHCSSRNIVLAERPRLPQT